MAEECQQQTLMVGPIPPVSVSLSQLENFHNVLSDKSIKEISTTDILQEALNSPDNFAPPSTFSNSQNFPDCINHLTDHSYIHCSDLNRVATPCSINSPNSISDNSLKIDSDNSRDVHLPSLSLEATSDLSNTTASQILEASFTGDAQASSTNKVLAFSTANENSHINVFADSSMNNPVCPQSILSKDHYTSVIETSVVESLSSELVSETVKHTTSIPISTNVEKTLIKLPTKQTNAPLGSLKNPIQIVQNGSSYHSTQVLSAAQLKQIARVLQRQQSQKVLQNRGKSVMYDPSTNTRIVCRIVHPSEIENKTVPTVIVQKTSDKSKSNLIRGRGRPRKVHSRKSTDDMDPTLSKEEREEKKKHRPRTRSGRISKPPSYMVKDYKRIHHLDFNEEPYDDSDGGYSDFKVSDDEEKRANKSKSLPPGVTTAKQRSYSCASCSKAYIGKGGLSRHLRLNPSHGRMPEGEDVSTQDENSNSSLASSILSNSGCNTNSQPFPSLVSPGPSKTEAAKIGTTVSPAVLTSATREANIVSNKRKAVLREALKGCSKEEISKVALPIIAQEISLWDFFLAKCNQKSEGLSIFEMLKEFEQFLSQMQRTSLSCLKPATLEQSQGKTIIHISSQHIAAALGLETGSFEIQTEDFSTADTPPVHILHSGEMLKSTDHPRPLKRKCMDSSAEDATGRLPEQILSEVMHGDGLDLPLTINLSSCPEIQGQDVHTLSTQLCNTEPSHDIVTKALYDLHSSTVVTPSSLSSGCLSAVVNASKVPPTALLASQSASKMQNIQVRKTQLFSSHRQSLLANNNLPLSINNLPLSVGGSVNDFPQESIAIPKPVEMPNVSMPLDAQIDIFSSSIQEISTHSVFDSVESSSVTVPNTSIIHELHVPNYPSNSCLKNDVPGNIDGNCVTETHINSLQNAGNIVRDELQAATSTVNTVVTDVQRDYQTTPNVIQDVGKLPESPAVLRHLMLPDGQVISIWSHVENTEKAVNEQFVQSYVPGNLIIFQNPDRSIQVPNNQTVQTEALHTLTTLNSSVGCEEGSNAFTSVQPM